MPEPPDPLFRTLADPARRALRSLCREGGRTLGALTARAGAWQPAVPKHLGLLRRAGLGRDRPEGRRTHHGAEPAALAPLDDWTREVARFWQDRLQGLEDLPRRMDQ